MRCLLPEQWGFKLCGISLGGDLVDNFDVLTKGFTLIVPKSVASKARILLGRGLSSGTLEQGYCPDPENGFLHSVRTLFYPVLLLHKTFKQGIPRATW